MTRCWLNGRVMRGDEARIDPSDRGFTLGDGVFETIRIEAGRPEHLGRHLLRLREGAAVLRISVPAMDDAIAAGIAVLTTVCGAEVARITLSRGPATRGLLPRPGQTPTLLITVAAIVPVTDAPTAILCRSTRRNAQSPLARIKSLNYLDGVLGRLEAEAAGADDAILLNTEGAVAEATAANVLVAQDGKLFTPRVEDGALPGITRALLIERAGVLERRLMPGDLSRAEAVILSNSLGLRALSKFGDRAYPSAPRLLEHLRGLQRLEATAYSDQRRD